MTDNEIIKYLEQAIDEYDKNEISISNIRIDKLSLDLITRQQEEIDRLKATVDSFTYIGKLYSEIKAEAIKEFAERLKNEINIRTTYSREQDKNVMRMIDNLVKELISDE